MRGTWLTLVLMLASGGGPAAAAGSNEFWTAPAELPFDVSVLDQRQESNICWQAMVYTSEIYREQPMRIFAFYAWPRAAGRHPAVISIHGGGGGADLARAQEFARAGYACLAYDWNAWRESNPKWKAGDPLPAGSNTVYCGLWYDGWVEHFCYPGPDGDWKWNTLYRSLTAARRGLTWMSQRPEVDPERLLAEGHSWGGFQAQTLAGLDPRLKAVVASASAGAWESRYRAGREDHTRGLRPEQAAEFFARYDPASFADRIQAPILIRLATADFFASVDNLAEYWDRITAPKALELLPAGNHTFWDVATRVAWFDAWVRDGPAFPTLDTVSARPDRGGAWTVTATAGGPLPITRAQVAWTTSTNAWWNRRGWTAQPLTRRDDGAWGGAFTPVATGGSLRWFVSVRDERGRVVSSLPSVQPLPATRARTPPPAPVRQADFRVAANHGGPPAGRDWRRAARVGPVATGPETVGLQSFELQALWDPQALHVRVAVRDATPWEAAGPGGSDGVQMRIADAQGTNAVARPGRPGGLRLSWRPGANGTIMARAEWQPAAGGTPAPCTAVAAAVVRDDAHGYVLTVAVPWAAIAPDFAPAAGRALDLRASVVFGDALVDECIATLELNRYDSNDGGSRGGLATLVSARALSDR